MDVLVVVAHPDDADVFCGGTIAKHAERGDEVSIVHMTRGEYGGLRTDSQEAVGRVREQEARDSGAVLGASEVAFLEFKDGRITYSLENRVEMVDVIREYDPDIILTHYKDDLHPDHRATSRLVTDAYYMASLPLVETDFEPCDPDNIYYFGKPTSEFTPSMFIDIDGYLEQKVTAIKKHESQVEFLVEHGGIDAEFDNLIDGLRAENLVFGKQAGARSAEGFVPLHESAQEFLG